MTNFLGWNSYWYTFTQNESENNILRLTEQHRGYFSAMSLKGEIKKIYIKNNFEQKLALGDWCTVENEFKDASNANAAFVKEVLPRRSHMTRARAGAEEHILIANLDILFIVTSCNEEFNVNRLKRYLILAQNGGVRAKVILSKTDLISQEKLYQYKEWTQKVIDKNQILTMSSLSQESIQKFELELLPGETYAFVGSSGVGKSTLINAILNQKTQETQSISDHEARGRHTTSAGKIFITQSQALIVDTPGIRSVEVIGSEGDVDEVFENISQFSKICKFRDCTHQHEPGCAVQAQVDQNKIEQNELDQYNKLKRQAQQHLKKLNTKKRKHNKTKQKSKKKDFQNKKPKLTNYSEP